MKINHIITEFVTPQATAQDPGLEREKDVDVIFFGRMPQDFTARTAWKALEDVLPREYPAGSEQAQNKIAEVSKNNGAVVTTKPLSIAQKLVKEFQARGIKCRINAPGLEEDITRRGFLQGAGAAAVAGAAGGVATKANAQEIVKWANYAAKLAVDSIWNLLKEQTNRVEIEYDWKGYVYQNVHNWVTNYCAQTNSYNAKNVIDYCNSVAYDSIGRGVKPDSFFGKLAQNITAGRMEAQVTKFVQAYRAAISEKTQEFNQAVQSQKHEKNVMGNLNKDEFNVLLDALIIYAICKDRQLDNSPLFKAISSAVTTFIKNNNAKDYVNSIYPKAKQSVELVKANGPEIYQQETTRYFKNAGDTIQRLNQISTANQPEFQESIREGVKDTLGKAALTGALALGSGGAVGQSYDLNGNLITTKSAAQQPTGTGSRLGSVTTQNPNVLPSSNLQPQPAVKPRQDSTQTGTMVVATPGEGSINQIFNNNSIPPDVQEIIKDSLYLLYFCRMYQDHNGKSTADNPAWDKHKEELSRWAKNNNQQALVNQVYTILKGSIEKLPAQQRVTLANEIGANNPTIMNKLRQLNNTGKTDTVQFENLLDEVKVRPMTLSTMSQAMAEGTAGLPDPQNFDSDNDYYDALDAYGKPQDMDSDYENMDETKEKIGNMDADAFDAALSRMKKLAGAGPLKTVYDPARRVYKNVPHAVQPAQQPKKVR